MAEENLQRLPSKGWARDDPQGLRSRSAPLTGLLLGHFLFLTSIISRI
jgi:hypothetical protein